MNGIGAIVGLLIGLTALGAGSLLTPLLMLLGGMSLTTAVGTSLAFSFATKLCGSWNFYRRGFVNARVLGDLNPRVLPGALAGGVLIRHLVTHKPRC